MTADRKRAGTSADDVLEASARQPRPRFGGSSNGRTADSDSASLGSNPSPPAKFRPLPAQVTYLGDIACTYSARSRADMNWSCDSGSSSDAARLKNLMPDHNP